MKPYQPSMSTCTHCGTFFVAADADDLASIESAHRCAAMIDRNVTQAFGFEKEQPVDRWRDLVTIQDARFLKAMRIDPL